MRAGFNSVPEMPDDWSARGHSDVCVGQHVRQRKILLSVVGATKRTGKHAQEIMTSQARVAAHTGRLPIHSLAYLATAYTRSHSA